MKIIIKRNIGHYGTFNIWVELNNEYYEGYNIQYAENEEEAIRKAKEINRKNEYKIIYDYRKKVKQMRINGKEIKAKEFAYDGCHKIYLIHTEEEKAEAKEYGYEIIPIDKIKAVYQTSCPLKFISDWAPGTTYAEQGEEAKIEE